MTLTCTTNAFARNRPPGSAASAGPAAAEGEEGAQPHGPVPYEKFVEDADVAAGLLTLVRKEGNVYVVLRSDQLDKEFYEHATTANGLGGFGVLSGDDFEQPARIVRFERVTPKSVAIVLPQDRFDATPERHSSRRSKPRPQIRCRRSLRS